MTQRSKEYLAPRPTLNPSRVHLRRRIRVFARHTKPGMLVLDAGAGHAPYRKMFAHAQYEAADFAQLGHGQYTPLDYVCDLSAIPVEDGRYDRVLTSQVFEHLPEPAAVARELHRVLKPGGRLLCSAPMTYHEHQEPYDFFRYTSYGLRRIFEDAGFEVHSVAPIEGALGVASYHYRHSASVLPTEWRDVRRLGTGWRALYLFPVFRFNRWYSKRFGATLARLDIHHTKVPATRLVKNWVLIAVKPRD